MHEWAVVSFGRSSKREVRTIILVLDSNDAVGFIRDVEALGVQRGAVEGGRCRAQ